MLFTARVLFIVYWLMFFLNCKVMPVITTLWGHYLWNQKKQEATHPRFLQWPWPETSETGALVTAWGPRGWRQCPLLLPSCRGRFPSDWSPGQRGLPAPRHSTSLSPSTSSEVKHKQVTLIRQTCSHWYNHNDGQLTIIKTHHLEHIIWVIYYCWNDFFGKGKFNWTVAPK